MGVLHQVVDEKSRGPMLRAAARLYTFADRRGNAPRLGTVEAARAFAVLFGEIVARCADLGGPDAEPRDHALQETPAHPRLRRCVRDVAAGASQKVANV